MNDKDTKLIAEAYQQVNEASYHNEYLLTDIKRVMDGEEEEIAYNLMQIAAEMLNIDQYDISAYTPQVLEILNNITAGELIEYMYDNKLPRQSGRPKVPVGRQAEGESDEDYTDAKGAWEQMGDY